MNTKNRLGEEQKGHVYNVVVARGRPIDINPWYSFIFKYRPRGVYFLCQLTQNPEVALIREARCHSDILIANNIIPPQFLPPQPNHEDPTFSSTEIQRVTEHILVRFFFRRRILFMCSFRIAFNSPVERVLC